MRIRLVTPEAGPRTGSRTYAARVAELLGPGHTVRTTPRLADPPAGDDIVHVLDLKTLVRAGTPAERPRAGALVLDLHDDYWTGRPGYPAFDRPLRRWRWRRYAPRYRGWLEMADQVVVHAGHVARALSHGRVTEVPYPADPALPRPPRPADPHRLRVLFAGRDSLRKGLEVLGEALRLLERGGLRTHLVVAGGDWLHLRLAARVWLRGLRVTRAGDLDATGMDRAYADADVVALPAWTETFGLVAQEAMLRGVPVVGTAVGGLGPLIEEAGGGMVVPPGDALALAGALRDVHRDPQRWGSRALRAGERLAATRDAATTAAALERAYRAALDHAAKAGSPPGDSRHRPFVGEAPSESGSP